MEEAIRGNQQRVNEKREELARAREATTAMTDNPALLTAHQEYMSRLNRELTVLTAELTRLRQSGSPASNPTTRTPEGGN